MIRSCPPPRRAPQRAARALLALFALGAGPLISPTVSQAAPSIVGILTEAIDNRTAHHTTAYPTSDRMVLRRGQSFDVFVDVQGFTPTTTLEFVAENVFLDGDSIEQDQLPTGTGLVPPGAWATRVVTATTLAGGTIRVRVRLFTPANAPIGQFTFAAILRDRLTQAFLDRSDFPKPVVLLCNPWQPRDDTYLAREDARTEYVLNPRGAIWQGSGTPLPYGWNFAQFDAASLDTALRLLEGVRRLGRQDPATVARVLADQVNYEADGGVLAGRWSGSYGFCYQGRAETQACSSDAGCDTSPGRGDGRCGLRPWVWNSSAAIASSFLLRGPDVRWAQCPVFGGVLVTMLRSLGIPARPVTNFNSIADRDLNGALDTYWEAQPDKSLKNIPGPDFFWNYHVWVEAWMRRPGGAVGGVSADGWQALDATPQVPSDGRYQLGPASVSLVRAGLDAAYDTRLVRTSVAGSTNVWVRKGPTAPWQLRATEPMSSSSSFPTRVLTRRPGPAPVSPALDDYVDVTSSYRPLSASAVAATQGQRLSQRTGASVAALAGRDVTFDLSTTTEVPLGTDATWSLRIENLSAATRTVGVRIAADAVAYDGEVISSEVAVTTSPEVVPPGGVRTVQLVVPPPAYLPFLGQTRTLEFSTTALVDETDDIFVDTSRAVVSVENPTVTLTPSATAGVGDALTASVQYRNPLGVPLTNVVLRYEVDAGATVDGTTSIEVPIGILGSGQTLSDTVQMVGVEAGEHLLSVALDAAELSELRGDATLVAVAPPPATRCPAEPLGGCRLAAPGASKLSIRAGATPEKSLLKWKWAKGEAMAADDVLDPIGASPTMRFCVYDGSAAAQPLLEVDVPAGGTCDGAPCWTRARSGKVSYKDPAGTTAGITAVRVKPAADGKALVQLGAKGANLPLPPLPLVAPVTVQWLMASEHATQCWQTTYPTVDVTPSGINATGP